MFENPNFASDSHVPDIGLSWGISAKWFPKRLVLQIVGASNLSNRQFNTKKFRQTYLCTMHANFAPSWRSCGCWRSLPVDINFVLVSSLRGALKKSTVGRLLCGAKDDGGEGWTPSIEPPLPNRHVYVGCINNVLCYIKEGRRSALGKTPIADPQL